MPQISPLTNTEIRTFDGFGISLTEGVGGRRTVFLSTPSVGNVPGLESPLDSVLILAKQVCR